MNNLKSIIEKLRKRLLEYRLKNKAEEISIHINSIDIAICLVEYKINPSSSRNIMGSEESWFNAGYYLDLVLRNSEWEDIVDLYYILVEEVKKRNFLRDV